MAVKISALPTEASPVLAAVLPLVQGGVTRKATLSALLALVATILSEPLTANASRDIAGTDVGKMVMSGAISLTVRANADVPLDIGTLIVGITTTGQTTFVQAAGVTINKRAVVNRVTAGTAAVWALYKSATNTWWLYGDLELT